MKKNKGITLIALVITIIILIILAGVSINLVFGQTGIITRAKEAKEATRAASVEDERNLWISEVELGQTLSENYKSLDEILGELKDKKLLSEEEVNKVKNDPNNEITIANKTISFKIKANGSSEEVTDEKWEESEDRKSITNGEITVEIGDKIFYNPIDGLAENYNNTYLSEEESNGYGNTTFRLKKENDEDVVSYDTQTYTWKVLGANEKGELLIVSENVIKPVSGGYKSTWYAVQGMQGYKNVKQELDNISKLYGQGYGATSARSIRIEDVNKITGYNPNNVGTYNSSKNSVGIKFGAGTISEYGNKITFSWDGTKLPVYSYGSTSGSLYNTHSKFDYYDKNTWKSINYSQTATEQNKEKIIDVENNYYEYFVSKLSKDSDGKDVGLAETDKKYTMLFDSGKYYFTSSNYNYVGLDSRSGEVEKTVAACVSYGMFSLGGSLVGGTWIHSSDGRDNMAIGYVLPVISLKKDIKIEGNSTDGWTILKK